MAALGGTPEDFRKYIEKEESRWAKVVQSAGLKK
jgi:tripartite-type tricarboxylate transporter receptor subunit TctC